VTLGTAIRDLYTFDKTLDFKVSLDNILQYFKHTGRGFAAC
jgi:hypothetical protein